VEKIGRNDPCPCGSGRKYKLCCMQLDAASSAVSRAAVTPDTVGSSAYYHYNSGNRLLAQGELDRAVASYRKAISLKGDLVEAHSNLGAALRQQGKLEEAAASYRNALSIRPDHATAHNNLGNVLRKLGNPEAALASYLRALEIKESPEAKLGFVACLKDAQINRDEPILRRLVIRAISEPWGRPHELASVAAGLIKLDKALRECIGRASQAWPERLSAGDLYGPAGAASVAGHDLLKCLLENTPSTDIELERFLTNARAALLDAAEASVEVEDEVLRFYCALARQCFINEYVFACTDKERDRAQSLHGRIAASLASGSPVRALGLIAVAAYLTLDSIGPAEAVLARTWPEAVMGLLVQQISEPAHERRLRADTPRLTSIEDDVSRKVQQQYEENPYPRWVKTLAGATVSIDAYLRQLFPLARFTPLGNLIDLDILVAGCGTGRETIEIAQRFAGARLLAVDLSLTSLAYARRKAREHGVENVEYAQADILNLGSIGRTFDVVSSVGVLHHLADPIEGWRVLLSLLRPGGFMRLGLYSRLGRQSINAARDLVARRGYDAGAESIRRCRQELMLAKDNAEVRRVVSLTDFYGTSQCRDMIFHVQEHQFTLPQIAERLREFNLSFVGFSLEANTVQRYREKFPSDGTLTDLDSWSAFEMENPDTFTGMYQFWVQLQAGAHSPRPPSHGRLGARS
jgi:SAM-dependent methyltransferase/tetratricopeptide (TPR) repeat protein